MDIGFLAKKARACSVVFRDTVQMDHSTESKPHIGKLLGSRTQAI